MEKHEIVDEVCRNPRKTDFVCVWTEDMGLDEDYWETGCGEMFIFSEGGVQENHFKFCPYCGMAIKEVRRVEPRLD